MAFVTRSGNILQRDGRRFRGFMMNWYGLIQSAYTTAQYQSIMTTAANRNLLGFRTWAFNGSGTDAANTSGNMFYLQAAGSNLISDGGFESGTSNFQLGSDFSRVSDGNSHGGSYAIKQVSTADFDNLTTINDATGIDVEAGTDYVFWVYVKCSITSGLGPIIQVNDTSAFGTQLGTYGSIPSTNGLFRKVGFTFNTGAQTKVWIRIFNNNGNVTCYYDDFYLAKLGGTLIFRETFLTGLDRCLAAAKEKNLVLLLPIMDNWGGQKEFINNCADQIYGITGMQGGDTAGWEFFTRTETKALYKSIIDTLAARTNTINGITYVNDDTIMWELGNELRYNHPTDTNQNSSSSSNYAAMGNAGGWIEEMLNYFKTAFPNHLVSAGDIGHFFTWFNQDPVYNGTQPYGVDFGGTGALTNNDLNDTHQYPFEDGSPYALKAYNQYLTSNASTSSTRANFLNQFANFATIAKASNNKPFVMGEIGMVKAATASTSIDRYPRSLFYQDFAPQFFNVMDGDIMTIWHGTTTLFDDNNYNVLIDGTLHLGGNANSNLNDDDSPLMDFLSSFGQQLMPDRNSTDSRTGGARSTVVSRSTASIRTSF